MNSFQNLLWPRAKMVVGGETNGICVD